jgi:microcystin-dependent protein
MSVPTTIVPRRRFIGRALAALAAGAWLGRGERTAEAGSDQPYLGEIRMFAGDFAPMGWAFCDGQLLSVDEYPELFALLQTRYGGDGQFTFAVPDLRGRAPVHMGTGPGLPTRNLGDVDGVETVTLTVSQIPAHSHATGASSTGGTLSSPTGGVPAIDASGAPRYGASPNSTLASGALLLSGGSQPHSNMQPYLALNFIIALFGVIPTP